MPELTGRPQSTAYALIDAGDGRRLEGFGPRVVDRPAQMATSPRLANLVAWRQAELRYDGRTGWFGEPEALQPWLVNVAGVTLELRPTESGGLGIYPEHLGNLEWLRDRVAARTQPKVLNLFAHTGLVSLAAARAGAAVTHVDAARAAVAWARRNAALSGLEDAPIRWIVDDAAAFLAREARRGRRYDGLIVDPPSFGRAGRARWRLVEHLPALLDACVPVLGDDAFALLTAHTTGLDGDTLESLAAEALGDRTPGRAEVVPLRLEATSGAALDLGWAVRLG